jgi:hypothetical protein
MDSLLNSHSAVDKREMRKSKPELLHLLPLVPRKKLDWIPPPFPYMPAFGANPGKKYLLNRETLF